MPVVDKTEISCGVYQLSGLHHYRPSEVLKRLMAAYKYQARAQGRKNGFAQVIFSDRTTDGAYRFQQDYQFGENFLSYLTKEFPNLRYTELESKRSPSTGNTIKTWVVNIPHVNFKKHELYAKVRALRHGHEEEYYL